MRITGILTIGYPDCLVMADGNHIIITSNELREYVNELLNPKSEKEALSERIANIILDENTH